MPQTPLTCEAAGAGGKPYPPTPTVSVVDSKASRVKMHGYAALDPSLTSVGVAKRSEADGAGNLSRLAKQPLAAWPLQVGGDPTLRGKGAGGFPCTPATWRTWGVGQRPTVLISPLGARSRECAKGTHLRGYSFIALRPLLCKGVVSTPYNHAAMQHWRLAPPIAA